MTRNFFLVSLILLLVSCTPKPPPVLPPRPKALVPDWISRQPADDNYWYGVGMADLKSSDDPRQAARQRAMSEIAEQLKVNVKSQLTDVMEATNMDYKEYSKSIIETRVEASLDYVEVSDSYQDTQGQYVLAKMNKQQYLDKLAREKQEAEIIAGDLIHFTVISAGSKIIHAEFPQMMHIGKPVLEKLPVGCIGLVRILRYIFSFIQQ